MKTAAALVVLGAMFLGCNDAETGLPLGGQGGSGGGAGGSSAGGSGGAAGQGTKVAVATGKSHTVQFGPIQVDPGKENTQCVVKRLGNAGPIHVGAIHNELGDASHHLIVYRVKDTEEQTTPFNCQPFTDTLDPSKGSTLMISQKRDDLLQLPYGVGYTLDDNQMVRLEMHYINAGDQPVTLTSTTTMNEVAPNEFKDEADFLFIGSPDIAVGPHKKLTLGPIFFQLPEEYSDVHFFAMTGHEHHFGTNVTVNLARNEDDTGTPIYDVPGWLWSEPKTVQFSPTVDVPKNGGFSFSCEWNNTSDKSVKFGESANDEMCFFWAYYYPSKGTGSKICVHSDKLAIVGKKDLCCPSDDPICDQINAQLGKKK
jgi:hypothetical protein